MPKKTTGRLSAAEVERVCREVDRLVKEHNWTMVKACRKAGGKSFNTNNFYRWKKRKKSGIEAVRNGNTDNDPVIAHLTNAAEEALERHNRLMEAIAALS